MPKRSKALQVVLEECQRFAPQVTLARRANLYRGLAELCGDPKKAVEYEALADQCDELRRREEEFQFRLSLEGDGK